MSKRLSGKTILITGASSGIGKSTAIEFSRTAPDVKLILAARRTDALQDVAKAIESESKGATKVKTMKLDVSDSADIQRFYKELNAEEEWKNVDVLVNNAFVISTHHFFFHYKLDFFIFDPWHTYRFFLSRNIGSL